MKIGEHTVKNVIANVSTKKDREFTLVGINFFDKFKNVIWNKNKTPSNFTSNQLHYQSKKHLYYFKVILNPLAQLVVTTIFFLVKKI